MTHGERTERKTSLLCDLFHIEMVVVVCVCGGGGCARACVRVCVCLCEDEATRQAWEVARIGHGIQVPDVPCANNLLKELFDLLLS